MTESKSAMAETVTMDKETLQLVLDYLSQKPYGEVHQIIGAIAQSIQRQAMIAKVKQQNMETAKAEMNGAPDLPPVPETASAAKRRRISKAKAAAAT